MIFCYRVNSWRRCFVGVKKLIPVSQLSPYFGLCESYIVSILPPVRVILDCNHFHVPLQLSLPTSLIFHPPWGFTFQFIEYLYPFGLPVYSRPISQSPVVSSQGVPECLFRVLNRIYIVITLLIFLTIASFNILATRLKSMLTIHLMKTSMVIKSCITVIYWHRNIRHLDLISVVPNFQPGINFFNSLRNYFFSVYASIHSLLPFSDTASHFLLLFWTLPLSNYLSTEPTQKGRCNRELTKSAQYNPLKICSATAFRLVRLLPNLKYPFLRYPLHVVHSPTISLVNASITWSRYHNCNRLTIESV